MKATAIIASAVLLAAGASASGRADDAQRVLVVPFSVLNVSESQQWIGKGVQENVIAELGRAGDFSPIAFQGQMIVEDNATAARLARAAQSPLVVRGAAQAVGGNIRLTAQLIDSKSGDTVRTASVTGLADNLLKMEDDLAAQLRGMPPAGSTPAASAPATTVSTYPTPVVQQQPVQPQIIVISQPPASYYPDNSYLSYPGYGYAYGGYPYAPFYSGFPIIVTQIGHDDHHDHHFSGGGFGNGGGGGGGGRGFQPVLPGGGGLVPAISTGGTRGRGH